MDILDAKSLGKRGMPCFTRDLPADGANIYIVTCLPPGCILVPSVPLFVALRPMIRTVGDGSETNFRPPVKVLRNFCFTGERGSRLTADPRAYATVVASSQYLSQQQGQHSFIDVFLVGHDGPVGVKDFTCFSSECDAFMPARWTVLSGP